MARPEEMKEYLIITALPPLTDEIKRMGPAAGEAFRKSKHRGNIVSLARKIERTVLKHHGGEILEDGSAYGVKDHPRERMDMIRLRTTAAGIEALKQVKEIGRISETIDFDNLRMQPDGLSNIPPGVSWSRPGRRR